jgi:hypothetical protein
VSGIDIDYQVIAVVTYEARLFELHGHARRWADAIDRRFTGAAKRYAPSRSGELRAGIFGEVDREGRTTLGISILSTAPHTMYVLGGTKTPIMSDGGWGGDGTSMMRLRPGNGYPQMYRHVVRGQAAQNFFGKAADEVALHHSSLRGFRPEVQQMSWG